MEEVSGVLKSRRNKLVILNQFLVNTLQIKLHEASIYCFLLFLDGMSG
jgi:hypothetical protein